MNKWIITLFISLFIMTGIEAQDIDIYHKGKNDNYNIPTLPKGMTYEEFNMLSYHTRMKDMLYTVIVPGYMHFRIGENKKGYWLLGVRLASYAAMTGVYYSAKAHLYGIDEEELSTEEEEKAKNRHENVFYSALTIAAASYLYDVIHGDYILHEKQERIRFKYAVTALRSTGYKTDKWYPALSLTLSF
jgi:hypothetical protein